jgi:hypothetical protein
MRAEEWAKWRDVISEREQSGKSLAVFCQERNLRVWQFHESCNALDTRSMAMHVLHRA